MPSSTQVNEEINIWVYNVEFRKWIKLNFIIKAAASNFERDEVIFNEEESASFDGVFTQSEVEAIRTYKVLIDKIKSIVAKHHQSLALYETMKEQQKLA